MGIEKSINLRIALFSQSLPSPFPLRTGGLIPKSIRQVKCLKFKVPKVPKVKGTKMTITCFGPVFVGLKMGFPILLNYSTGITAQSPLGNFQIICL